MPASSPAVSQPTSRFPNPVAVWLAVCCAMIFAMVVLGGVTRLTHSGLSIAEWQPLLGWIPPLSDAAWAELFQKYQATPEYRQVNTGMTLAEFKPIFWIEYVHRLWGRLIGLVFVAPLAYFALRGRIDKKLLLHLLAILALGVFQGALGWLMVKSGLVDRPNVSQYRLTAHLAAAFVIYGYMFWVFLGVVYARWREQPFRGLGNLPEYARFQCVFVFLTVLAGGLTAGTHSGLAYNTFPLMAGRIMPEGMFKLHPWYLNFFENIATIQFTHRVLALLTVISVTLFRLSSRRLAGSARLAANAMMALVLVQAGLGIATLLFAVPPGLAAAHQAGALALFTAALWTAHCLKAGAAG